MIASILSRSGFVWASVFLLALMVFAKVSIDQVQVEKVRIVGSLDEPMLIDIKKRLDETDAVAAGADQVKAVLTELDWVHHVNVRRDWPVGLSIEVTPEKVIAYWNDDGFINEEGRVLVTDLLVGGDLPHLYGPDGKEFEVMMRFQQLNRVLAGYGHEIRVLNHNERGAWSMETRDRIEVLLGKEDLMARLQRFLMVTQSLEDSGDTRVIERMDARYINGVAVHFNENNQLNLADINNSVGDKSL